MASNWFQDIFVKESFLLFWSTSQLNQIVICSKVNVHSQILPCYLPVHFYVLKNSEFVSKHFQLLDFCNFYVVYFVSFYFVFFFFYFCLFLCLFVCLFVCLFSQGALSNCTANKFWFPYKNIFIRLTKIWRFMKAHSPCQKFSKNDQEAVMDSPHDSFCAIVSLT